MNYYQIPNKLKAYPHWVVWKLIDKDGKKTKVPYCVRGGFARVNDPNTWDIFDNAIRALQSGDYNGIGFVFTGTPFIGIDIDGCIDENDKISAKANDILEILKSYTEVSQSGKGFHVIIEGKLPDGKRRNGAVEMYGDSSPRYFALTGDLWGNYNEIKADQKAIDLVYQKYIESSVKISSINTGEGQDLPPYLFDQEILERAKSAKNGNKFFMLWSGDTSAYENDDSRADLALCNILAFWCQRDFQRIDRLFRKSGLMRPKWDERRGQDTYGNLTIREAIANCKDTYTEKADMHTSESMPEVWDTPIPFQTVNAPNFPTDCLPEPIASFVKALAESTQTSEEMGGILSLGILATVFQSRYEVEIKSDWKEPLCLYTLAIAPPAERKSAVIAHLTAPVYHYEAARRESEQGEIARNRAERDFLEQKLQNMKKKLSRSPEKQNNLHEEILKTIEELDRFEDKHAYRLLVDDTTPEKLVEIMDTQKGCITILSAEGGVFDTITGRYNKSANFDIYLKGHAGDPIAIDRIGRATNYIEHPRLSMILTLQPHVLHNLIENTAFRARGLCGRFLYAVCKSKIGYRKVDSEAIPEQAKQEYERFINHILSGKKSGVIRLSDEARKVQLEYAAQIEKRLGNEWESIRDWGGKLVGTMLRIAALLHAAELSENATEIPVGAKTITNSVKIAEYLGSHAMIAYQEMGADQNYEDAKYLLKRICGLEHGEILKSELFDICKGKITKVENMESALQVLVDKNFIKINKQQSGKKGRPSQKIIVNPAIKNSKNREIR